MSVANSLLFSIFITIIVIIICKSSEPQRQLRVKERTRRPENQCSTNYNIDYVLLSLQWPASFCWQRKSCNKHPNEWQIHGLWPQRRSGQEWPQFCCTENEFNASLIEPLKNQLLLKWQSLKADRKHELFWSHEWTKHGTCAQSLPLLRGPFNYFNTTLHLFDLFPFNVWLNKRGINADNDRHYSSHSIHESIEYDLKRKVRLECALINRTLSVLSEIHICLNKTSLQTIDCVHRDDHQCHQNHIIFPSH